MLGVLNFECILDDPDQVYSAGDKIKGSLAIHLRSPIAITGVTIYFKGAARAKWCELMDNGSRRTEIEHDKEEIYFDDRFCLWGKVDDKGGWESLEILEKGSHVFPFLYRLPHSLPCSFEGPDTFVRYTVQGRITGRDYQVNTKEKPFTIFKDFDPSLEKQSAGDVEEESVHSPIEDYTEKSLGNGCCQTGHVSCSITLEKQLFVPGENIIATITLQNISFRKCGSCNMQLKQIVRCSDSCPVVVIVASSKLCESIRPGQSCHWQGYEFMVPPTCPSRLDMCKIISIKYCVAIDTSFDDFNLYAAVPVVITTIPNTGADLAKWSFKGSQSAKKGSYQEAGELPHTEFAPKYKVYDYLPGQRNREINMLLDLPNSPGQSKRYHRKSCSDNSVICNDDDDDDDEDDDGGDADKEDSSEEVTKA
ncbi:arrestin domain-containing protein 3-like [Argonauta hians]